MAIIKLTRFQIIFATIFLCVSSFTLLLVLYRSSALEWMLHSYGYVLPTSLSSRTSWTSILHVAPLHVISQILVISLPRREDRRIEMDKLRGYLRLEWTYIDAFDADEPVIANILHQVHIVRNVSGSYSHSYQRRNFSEYANSDLWMHIPSSISFNYDPNHPLTCAKGENEIPSFTSDMHQHEVLSKGMIACWLSHLMALRIAAADSKATLILEDDVDIDWDLVNIVNRNWRALPSTWDIVYLGASLPPSLAFTKVRIIQATAGPTKAAIRRSPNHSSSVAQTLQNAHTRTPSPPQVHKRSSISSVTPPSPSLAHWTKHWFI